MATEMSTELREFMAQLKGRRPQEVIGIVSASLLVQSMTQAAFAVLGIMVVFTVGPYLIYGPPQPKQNAPKPAAANVVAESNTMPTQANPDMEMNAATATKELLPNAEKASQVMGLDQTKTADPKTNPLDSPNLDKLLDGLDR